MLACIAVSVIVVVGQRAVRYQPITVLCAIGPTLSVLGQTARRLGEGDMEVRAKVSPAPYSKQAQTTYPEGWRTKATA